MKDIFFRVLNTPDAIFQKIYGPQILFAFSNANLLFMLQNDFT